MAMIRRSKRDLVVVLLSAFTVLATSSGVSQEGQSDQTAQETEFEEVVIVGTRRAGRSSGDSPVPIDVINASDFASQGNTDLNSMLRSVVPSFNVSENAINDAATLIRPANLRGLPSDSTLVLVNGKRRHRASVISFLGGGINDGAQGPDISIIPSIGLKQVQVLRDGAAAQYGSDAIAGVMNFVLKDDAEGGSIEGRWGEYYEGDGATFQIAGNLGLPITDEGFINLSAEYKEADPTSRSVQRTDAAALTAAGNTDVKNPAQIWGSPEVKSDFKFFFNSELNVSDSQRVYMFGNWAEREIEGGFYYRNPNTRTGVFADGNGDILVGDSRSTAMDGSDAVCPAVNIVNGVVSPSDLATVNADPNCWAFQIRYPGGFTPQFGGKIEDYSLALGTAGELDNGLSFDVSGYYGRNASEFVIKNTVNASMGEDSPSSFKPGGYTQEEKSFNVDLVYPVEIGLASELNIATGVEWRDEEFEITAGDEASYLAGPLRFQGFSVGSNGFQGFSPKDAGAFSRSNNAIYIDLEADVFDPLLVGFAIRREDFDDFGDTTNFKVSSRWQIVEPFALRAAYSTGFRAPTVGQSNVRSTTTNFGTSGQLAEELIIPPDSALGASKGGKALEPEESVNMSFGAVLNIVDLSLTMDIFRIEVDDRIALTDSIDLSDADRAALLAAGVTEAATVTKIRFFTNDFNTTTSGVDIVATYPIESSMGNTDLSFTYNYTNTEVETPSGSNISATRVRQLEESIPQNRWTFTATQTIGVLSGLIRLSFYDEFFEAHADSPGLPIESGEIYIVDAEVSYTHDDMLTVSLGAQNLFDEYPDENPHKGELGAQYPVIAPAGFNGGFYYLRMSYMF